MLARFDRSGLRILPLLAASLASLHCGTGPDGDGTGGSPPGTGGENLGGGDAGGAAADGSTGGSGGGSGGLGGSDSGGAEASGGESSGGAPGASVVELSVRTIDKVDVLFVVDNSISMADKQALFVKAVPEMLERLVTPDCIDLFDGTRSPSQNLACEPGSVLEMEPASDLHIGVISTSLGDFGSGVACTSGHRIDKARLIPEVRVDVPDPDGLGFLSWSGGDADEVAALNATFTEQIAAVGETGCGFEAPLEAWYRFLVDPSPPLDLELQSNVAVSTAVDTAILEQRSAFLRPDSLVAIVMLTDEDDCSGMEGGGYYPYAGYGWLTTDLQQGMRTASAECATNPNDVCCYSCLRTSAPDGCVDTCARDAGGNGSQLPITDDRGNLRCHQGQRRFGLDLLYPIQRYIDGLKQATIVDTQATADEDDPVFVPNPLLRGANVDPGLRSPRPPHQVFLAGIVGVPWQDIATPATREDPDALEYLDAQGLNVPVEALGGANRWALILGEPGLPAASLECQGTNAPAACGAEPVPPLDPFMLDSITPRSGENPLTGDPIVGLGAAAWSPINGSEYDNSVPGVDGNTANDDLQYACIFPLDEDAVKHDCASEDPNCDCGYEPSKGSPLCKPAGSLASTPATTTQSFGKAYPAKRLLQVLRGFGEDAIVASICPKILDQPESPYFGYTPALNAVVERLAGTRGATCLTSSLSWDDEEEAGPCAILEATLVAGDCSRAGRSEVDPSILGPAAAFLEEEGLCDGDECEEYGLCALEPVDDPEPCFGTTAAESQAAGYCLIDPSLGPAFGGQGADCTEDPESWDECENPNSAVCPSSQGRLLRFVGESTPERGALVFRICAPE